ncbi:MAG: hypothetical protein OEY33_09780, partial [Bdellovibrionales bacterium]|nr:hypothetical protein [Bdellovibrionales bacterium]
KKRGPLETCENQDSWTTCDAQGLGTELVPYIICNVAQFENIEDNINCTSAYFRQGGDIDFSEDGIDNDDPQDNFTGNYDGNGFKLINFRNLGAGSTNHGVFAETSGATLKNIHVRNVLLSDYSSQGGLVGYADNTVIDNCSVTGDLNGITYVGGLVGRLNNSTVQNSYAEIYIHDSNDQKGGLVGRAEGNSLIRNSHASIYMNNSVGHHQGGLAGVVNSSKVTRSYSEGIINHTSSYQNAGGLIGIFENGSYLSESYSFTNVSGGYYVGGLVGRMLGSSKLRYSYSAGDVKGSYDDVGGLIGRMDNGTVKQAFSLGVVDGDDASLSGGFIGNFLSGTVEEGYYNKDPGFDNSTSPAGIGKTLVELSNPETFKGWHFGNVWAYDGSNPITLRTAHKKDKLDPLDVQVIADTPTSIKLSWTKNDSSTSSFILAQAQSSSALADCSGGTDIGNVTEYTITGRTSDLPYEFRLCGTDGSVTSEGVSVGSYAFKIGSTCDGQSAVTLCDAFGAGISSDPYILCTATQLNNLSTCGVDKHFKLGSDIDLNAISYTSPVNFSGSFDGDGYTIYNLAINEPTTDNIGMFSTTATGAVIKNLTLANVSITGQNNVGAVAGSTSATSINNITLYGTVNGVSKVGGVVGYNSASDAKFVDSHVSVTGSGDNVGGIFGEHLAGRIEFSYS